MLKHNHKVTLSGATPSWDFRLGNFAQITLSTNATISIANSNDMDSGILTIIGDGTHTIDLSGVNADNLEVLTGSDDRTIVAFVNDGGTIYWSLVAQMTAAPLALSDLLFATNTDLSNSSQIFTSPGGGSSFGNTGLDAKKLPAGISGRIWYKFVNTGSENCVLGFNTANAQTGYAGMEAGIFFGNGPTTIKHIDSGTPGGSYGSPTTNYFYGLYRDGATGAIKLQYSSDEVSWTDIATLTYNSTGDLYIVCDIGGSQTMSYPKGQNIA